MINSISHTDIYSCWPDGETERRFNAIVERDPAGWRLKMTLVSGPSLDLPLEGVVDKKGRPVNYDLSSEGLNATCFLEYMANKITPRG